MSGGTRAHRVVLVGHGMVGARFLDDLDRLARTTDARLDVTVLGDEPYEPYNRLMLSEVIAGRADLNALTLPAPPGQVRVHRGSAAAILDRDRKLVIDEFGREHPYDTVVLATGSAARIPPIEGLHDDEHGLAGVRALRSIDDCRDLLAACSRVGHVTVLGGGLLGVEVACGLRTRDVQVTVVHLGGHVMERQLDATSAAVAGSTMADLGIDVRTGVGLQQVHRDGAGITHVTLSDGGQIETDLVVLSAGVAPRVEIASAAALSVGHGIVVGDDLRSVDDPSVAAIGDCAETPTGCPGLLAPGWEQAHRLAASLVEPTGALAEVESKPGDEQGESPYGSPGFNTGSPSGSPGSTSGSPGSTSGSPGSTSGGSVVKLKAVGLDVVALGEPLPADDHAIDGPHIVSLVDPRGRRAIRVLLQDNRIAGAVCVGSPEVAADLTVAYEHGTEVPDDPALLLVRGPAAAGVPTVQSPTAMPGSATVCRCNGVTKKEIVDAHVCGDRSIADVACRTRATTGCGGCTGVVQGLLDWMDDVNPDSTESPLTALEHQGETV
ncbi:FAD-dependent oxidoreductase [Luteipulveratus halotolerans]|uniref:Electron transfer flavoprotein n=1 Tax=Luteipulveratus halotolerans TaxID=1631356 RepID=A0A0L6CKK8_9MICO|nr:FAD-dependent oxidoreductase [Luteipulveratus halotolerans]KNX38331.1 hypothetical protein VV01_16160 [Luteipulveratus halotolerans]